jgi:hypothetical protein
MAIFSVYRTLAAVEKYFAGYKPEHVFLGLQVGRGNPACDLAVRLFISGRPS